MSISRQNLSVVIVTFKSDNVIHDCINQLSMKLKLLLLKIQDKNLKKILKKI